MADLTKSDARGLKIVLAISLILQLALWVLPLIFMPTYYASLLGLPYAGVSLYFWARLLGLISLALAVALAVAIQIPSERTGIARTAMWIYAFAAVGFIWYVGKGLLSAAGSALAFANMGCAIAIYAMIRPSNPEAEPEEEAVEKQETVA